MLSKNENRLLNKIYRNNLSEDILKYALFPEFLYNYNIEEYKFKMRFPEIAKQEKFASRIEEFTKKEIRDFNTIGKLVDRKLIFRCVEKIDQEKDDAIAYFKITDYGCNSLLEYRQWYKFWIPLVTSIGAIVISLFPYLFS